MKITDHSWQSMRDRFLKRLQPQFEIYLTQLKKQEGKAKVKQSQFKKPNPHQPMLEQYLTQKKKEDKKLKLEEIRSKKRHLHQSQFEQHKAQQQKLSENFKEESEREIHHSYQHQFVQSLNELKKENEKLKDELMKAKVKQRQFKKPYPQPPQSEQDLTVREKAEEKCKNGQIECEKLPLQQPQCEQYLTKGKKTNETYKGNQILCEMPRPYKHKFDQYLSKQNKEKESYEGEHILCEKSQPHKPKLDQYLTWQKKEKEKVTEEHIQCDKPRLVVTEREEDKGNLMEKVTTSTQTIAKVEKVTTSMQTIAKDGNASYVHVDSVSVDKKVNSNQNDVDRKKKIHPNFEDGGNIKNIENGCERKRNIHGNVKNSGNTSDHNNYHDNTEKDENNGECKKSVLANTVYCEKNGVRKTNIHRSTTKSGDGCEIKRSFHGNNTSGKDEQKIESHGNIVNTCNTSVRKRNIHRNEAKSGQTGENKRRFYGNTADSRSNGDKIRIHEMNDTRGEDNNKISFHRNDDMREIDDDNDGDNDKVVHITKDCSSPILSDVSSIDAQPFAAANKRGFHGNYGNSGKDDDKRWSHGNTANTCNTNVRKRNIYRNATKSGETGDNKRCFHGNTADSRIGGDKKRFHEVNDTREDKNEKSFHRSDDVREVVDDNVSNNDDKVVNVTEECSSSTLSDVSSFDAQLLAAADTQDTLGRKTLVNVDEIDSDCENNKPSHVKPGVICTSNKRSSNCMIEVRRRTNVRNKKRRIDCGKDTLREHQTFISSKQTPTHCKNKISKSTQTSPLNDQDNETNKAMWNYIIDGIVNAVDNEFRDDACQVKEVKKNNSDVDLVCDELLTP